MKITRGTWLVLFGILMLTPVTGCDSDDGAKSDGQVEAGNSRPDPAAHGEEIYLQYCAACHRKDGSGMGSIYPPLAESDFLEDKDQTIRAVVNGLQGPITVGGKGYSGTMPPLPPQFDDQAAADVINYLVARFGGGTWQATADEVAEIRD